MPATIPVLQEGRYSIEQEFPYVENCFLFQAYDTQNETPVTIVEVPVRLPKVATTAQREAMSASFAEQAKVLTAFKHKSVVAVRSYFTEAGRNYLVTDRVDGVDLASVLADQKQPFTVTQMAGWADTVLDALNLMHNSRPALIYRNLRPENIMLRSDGNVDLVASGMICCGDQGAANAGSSPLAYSPLEQIWSGLDAASQKVIISKYDEASERILKQGLDAKSDLYSLGATLYHLVSGHVPVDALERSIEMIEGNADPLRSPNKVNASVPVEVSDVIMKAMEIRREYRFDSAAIMRQVLKTALVRVREREAEEALVQKVEQTDVRPAVQNVPPLPVPEKKDEEAAVAQKLREAEEKRLEAERRAAEAEKKLHETETAQTTRVTETFNLVELEDDVLGILAPSTHTSVPPQTKGAATVDQALPEPVIEQTAEEAPEVIAASSVIHQEPAPVLEKALPEKEAETANQEESLAETPAFEPELTESVSLETKSEPEEEPQPEPVKEMVETAAPAKAAAAAALFSTVNDREIFTERKTGSGIGLPAIAAAAVVLCVAAIGGWFYLGSKPAPAAAVETPAASQPAQSAPQEPAVKTALQANESPVTTETTSVPATDQPAADQPQNDPLSGQDQQPQKTASTAPSKSKRSAQTPAKTPAQKKAVTVDDLINDN
jgi:serine/threonine protein kinase